MTAPFTRKKKENNMPIMEKGLFLVKPHNCLGPIAAIGAAIQREIAQWVYKDASGDMKPTRR